MGKRDTRSMILNIDSDMLMDYFVTIYGLPKVEALLLIQRLLNNIKESNVNNCDALYGLCEQPSTQKAVQRKLA